MQLHSNTNCFGVPHQMFSVLIYTLVISIGVDKCVLYTVILISALKTLTNKLKVTHSVKRRKFDCGIPPLLLPQQIVINIKIKLLYPHFGSLQFHFITLILCKKHEINKIVFVSVLIILLN